MQTTTNSQTSAPESSKADVREKLTNQIIEMLEKGGLQAMEQWTRAAGSIGRPINGATKKPYTGGNVLFLWAASLDAGYTSPVWLTFKQAKTLGGMVRKGEHATLCAYWKKFDSDPRNKAAEVTDEDGQPQKNGFLMCKPFYLFNIAQIDGLPPEMYEEDEASAPVTVFEPISAAEELAKAAGAVIRYGGDRAFFKRSADFVQLPERSRFKSAETFYAVMQHELIHWTGHESRLNRQFGKRFGDSAYAFEELVAELGAAFLAAHFGFVDATVEGHAHYVQSWLQVLRNDRNAIFTAASKASEAADFLVAMVQAQRNAKAA